MTPEPSPQAFAPVAAPLPPQCWQELTPRTLLRAVGGYLLLFALAPFLLCLLPHL